MKKHLLTILLIALFGCFAHAQETTPEKLFYQAVYAEQVEGDLTKARRLYEEILKQKMTDRSMTARTMFRLGLISEKEGAEKALGYYSRIIEQFPDQKEVITLVEARVDKLGDARTFTDPRDGHKYRWVKIGNQIWMAENLAYMPYVNPPKKQEYGIWVYDYAGEDVAEAAATENYMKYGCLYDWITTMGLSAKDYERMLKEPSGPVQGICPPGWHVPSDQEWKTLETTLGLPDSIADMWDLDRLRQNPEDYNLFPMVGKTMKSSSGWFVEGNGDNQSGFGALPAGERQSYQISNYFGLGYFAYFWTSTPTYWWEAKDTTKNHYTAVARSLDAKKVDIGRDNWPPRWEGFSVRCMKDDAVPPPVSISRPVNQKPKLSAVKPIQPSKPTEIILKAKVVDSIPNSDPALKQGFSNFHIEPGLLILGKVNSPELVALNPDSHDTLWKWVANENLQPARVLENMGIILVQSKTHLNGIRKSDGQLLWTRQGSFGIQFSVMKDSVMYIPKLDSLLAVNCVNGNLLWGIAGGERTYYHPDLLGDLLIYPLANTQYTRNPEIVPKKVTMTAIDRFTGKSLWQYQSLGNPWSCKVIDSLALISPLSTEMGSYCIAVNSGTGEEVWRTYLMHTSSPGRFLDWNNSAFCIGGGYSSDFYAFRIGSDGNLLWKTIIPRPINHGNETPVLNQGKAWFIFMRDDKRGGLAGIDPETGRTLYVLDLPSKPVTYPVFLDGKIYISLMTGFFIIQAPTL